MGTTSSPPHPICLRLLCGLWFLNTAQSLYSTTVSVLRTNCSDGTYEFNISAPQTETASCRGSEESLSSHFVTEHLKMRSLWDKVIRSDNLITDFALLPLWLHSQQQHYLGCPFLALAAQVPSICLNLISSMEPSFIPIAYQVITYLNSKAQFSCH